MSLAAASPGARETTERVRLTDEVNTPRHADGDWVEIATPTPTSHGREYIEVGADAGSFRKIRISATTGRPIVRTVRVDYKDGTHRYARVDAVIDKQHPAYIDLKGAREIERVVVLADTDSRGTYAIHGEIDTTND